MSRIQELAQALERGKARFEQLMSESPDAERNAAYVTDEIYRLRAGDAPVTGTSDRSGTQLHLFDPMPEEDRDSEAPPALNRIAAGENLDYMVWLLRERNMAGRIQLIYTDPPFFSNAKYQASVQIRSADGSVSPVLKVGAYNDQWGHDFVAYLQMLAVRFYLMRELLSDTGSLWVHLDWHGSHYVKMMLDEIFGADRFVNEVAWTYKSGGAGTRSFARKHDTLLFYSKTKDYKFNLLKEKSYNRGGKPYRFRDVEEFEDEHGWYTMVNMKDVWNIDMVGRTSSERMGYATQKPEKLLERIVEACSDEGDLCADFFAGTGTLGAVCGKKNRRWILCDEGDAAIAEQILRLADQDSAFLVERPEKEYEVGPRSSVEVTVSDEHIMLERYQPDLSLVRQSDRQTVSEFIARNSLDVVSFWSVDTDYDGNVHRCRRLLSGGDVEEGAGGESLTGHRISVVGYDLFGGRFTWEDNL